MAEPTIQLLSFDPFKSYSAVSRKVIIPHGTLHPVVLLQHPPPTPSIPLQSDCVVTRRFVELRALHGTSVPGEGAW